MPTSTKHYGRLTTRAERLIKKAKKAYPDMDWMIQEAAPEISEVWGDGFLFSGKKGLFEQTYFILWEDPRKENWIAMIAHNVEEKIRNAT